MVEFLTKEWGLNNKMFKNILALLWLGFFFPFFCELSTKSIGRKDMYIYINLWFVYNNRVNVNEIDYMEEKKV